VDELQFALARDEILAKHRTSDDQLCAMCCMEVDESPNKCKTCWRIFCASCIVFINQDNVEEENEGSDTSSVMDTSDDTEMQQFIDKEEDTLSEVEEPKKKAKKKSKTKPDTDEEEDESSERYPPKNQTRQRASKPLDFFKQATQTVEQHNKRNAVIMGRRTWESLSCKPLAKRLNIVLSSSFSEHKQADVTFAPSLDSALATIQHCHDIETTFIIGGSSVYEEALTRDVVDRVLLTRIQSIIPCDVFLKLHITIRAVEEKRSWRASRY
jgi:dihydrofolate reductase